MPHTARGNLIPRLVFSLKGGYSAEALFSDLLAGLTVAVIALPLAMALGIASGATPAIGLCTAVVAGFLISALGGSRVQVGGPTGAFVVIVAKVIHDHGFAGLAMATFMAGIMLLLLGAARYGTLIKFIPHPVIAGFTAGIAVIIFSTQIKDLVGLSMESTGGLGFLELWRGYLGHISSWNPRAAAVAAGSLAVLIVLRRWAPRMPAALVAVAGAAVAVRVFGLEVDTIGSRFGVLPQGLPAPSLAWFDLARVNELFPAAITIALLAGIESLLSAVVADGMTGDRHNSNMELIAQGVANIASVCFGGLPATGAIARTAANVKAGARTPIAGMSHAVFLLLCLFFLAPLARGIPLSSLAAVLVIVAWNMSEAERFVHLLKAPRADVVVLIVSFLLTVLVDLTVAVEAGIVLAALMFMKRMSEASEAVSRLTADDSGTERPIEPDYVKRGTLPPGIEAFQMNGPLFFGVVDRLHRALDSVERVPKVFILRMRRVTVIDASGLNAVRELHERCRRGGTLLLLTGVQPEVEAPMRKMGLWEKIGSGNICANIDAALARAKSIE